MKKIKLDCEKNKTGLWTNKTGLWKNKPGLWKKKTGLWRNKTRLWRNKTRLWKNKTGLWKINWTVSLLSHRTKWLTKECFKQKSRGSSCDPALSVDDASHHQDNTWSVCEHLHPHWITVSCHGVEGPMATGGGKKKDDRKTKAFYDWATTGIPVMRIK